MPSEITELRSAVESAFGELEAAAAAMDAPAPDADLDALQATFDEADSAHKRACEAVERAERVAEARGALPVQAVEAAVVAEPLTYERQAPNSIFRDLVSAQKGDTGAAGRLERHMTEMSVEQRTSALDSTDSNGGYLVPPLWLQDEFVTLARAGRKVVDAIGTKPLPANTDSINIPTMDGGTAVATQSDSGAVQDTTATFNTISGAVQTIAGLQNVSQQLVDRSVPGVDEVIFGDLTRAYASKLESQFFNSTTTNAKGLTSLSGVNSITYTDASPTVSELYPKLADAIQQVETSIYQAPTHILMAPRRWAFFLAGSDGNQRPLVTPYAPFNAVGTADAPAAEGPVGSILGLPVYTSANIATNLGSGTNQDEIYVVNAPSLYVYEDTAGPYLDTFRDVLSGTLQVRFRLFSYYSLILGRRPGAISKIGGSGLAAPSF